MSASPRPKLPSEHEDVYGLLEDIRLRPELWVPGRRLGTLQTLLWGYGLALEVHGVEEQFAFGSSRDFSSWLAARFGWGMSLGWACAIEEYGGADDPLDLFFRLVDEYRAELKPE
ncbi:hypothetical protein UK23_15070 [Lentzea aerocolonigenes]|uniref:Uncharacterized protein n=1 Tax=Lentzea aerocolonigenes TaxID=68170 RepID=A0A0F0H430_LENAE|nr:hypothetical protein [Lentzea aerocolonigenes]KJK49047.1 hypothetical protein UK23_15070 [Lentzea aerocolonigenes]